MRELHYKVRLNARFRSDLKWWSCFLPVWNGKELMSSVTRSGPPVVITSDASGSWGCGAFTSTGEWFQLKLPETWSDIHITVKELLPIILGVAVWGWAWRGYKVTCLCDNTAVVAIVNLGRSRMDRVMHLMRSLTFFLARWGVSLSCTYLPGVENGAADALSWNNVSLFQRLVPTARKEHTVLTGGAWCTRLLTGRMWIGSPCSVDVLEESTQKAYASGQRCFFKFCLSAGLRAVPASEEVLYKFAAKMACEGLQHRTIKSYMAGVRHLHIEDGMGDPFMSPLPRLHYVMRGVKRHQGEAGKSGRERLPITPDILRKIKSVWDQTIAGPRHCHAVGSMLPSFFQFSEGRRVDYAG